MKTDIFTTNWNDINATHQGGDELHSVIDHEKRYTQLILLVAWSIIQHTSPHPAVIPSHVSSATPPYCPINPTSPSPCPGPHTSTLSHPSRQDRRGADLAWPPLGLGWITNMMTHFSTELYLQILTFFNILTCPELYPQFFTFIANIQTGADNISIISYLFQQ